LVGAVLVLGNEKRRGTVSNGWGVKFPIYSPSAVQLVGFIGSVGFGLKKKTSREEKRFPLFEGNVEDSRGERGGGRAWVPRGDQI